MHVVVLSIKKSINGAAVRGADSARAPSPAASQVVRLFEIYCDLNVKSRFPADMFTYALIRLMSGRGEGFYIRPHYQAGCGGGLFSRASEILGSGAAAHRLALITTG